MMGCSAATLGVIILSGFINLSAAKKNTCDIYAAVGQNLSLPFAYTGLTNTHVVKWTHNNRVVFLTEKSKVTVGKKEDISPLGSLLVKNLQFSDAGIYQATVVHSNGTTVGTWSGQLCVMDKVSKPHLTYVCDFKSGAVNLNCIVTNPQGLVFSWTQDKKTLPRETRQTLTVSLAQLKGEGNFICSVGNKGSTETSNVVHPTCKSPSPLQPTLHCVPLTIVLAVLAGGGGLILILLIIIIILCCRHKRNKTRMKPGNTVELRMPSIKQQESGPGSPDYETMHATEDYPRLSPKPSPRGCYKNVSQPEGQNENQPVELSTAVEKQDPSPVPKPRTKSPLNPNFQIAISGTNTKDMFAA